MSAPAKPPALLPSLGRLVRGLSSLFWGLPLMLVLGVQTAKSNWLGQLGILPPLLATALVLYGLRQLGYFHSQERPWTKMLDRAKLVGLVNLGLSPFLFWWHQLPKNEFFTFAVGLLSLSSLVFLFLLNLVLQRLAAMLPDETLRYETNIFTSFNLYLVVTILAFLGLSLVLIFFDPWPDYTMEIRFLLLTGNLWMLVLPVLVPVAMTMALIWKTKEVILTSIFNSGE